VKVVVLKKLVDQELQFDELNGLPGYFVGNFFFYGTGSR
jgi:hypothetical protein